MAIKDQLLEKLSRTSDLPFLFIGSGMSRRYLNLETWGDLLRKFADQTGTAFEYYLTKADGDFPKLASLLVDSYYDVWWKNPEFEPRRVLFRSKLKRKDSPLRIEIAEYIGGMTKTVPDVHRAEVDLLQKIEVDGIITTNWDTLLEKLFPQYEVFIGQES